MRKAKETAVTIHFHVFLNEVEQAKEIEASLNMGGTSEPTPIKILRTYHVGCVDMLAHRIYIVSADAALVERGKLKYAINNVKRTTTLWGFYSSTLRTEIVHGWFTGTEFTTSERMDIFALPKCENNPILAANVMKYTLNYVMGMSTLQGYNVIVAGLIGLIHQRWKLVNLGVNYELFLEALKLNCTQIIIGSYDLMKIEMIVALLGVILEKDPFFSLSPCVLVEGVEDGSVGSQLSISYQADSMLKALSKPCEEYRREEEYPMMMIDLLMKGIGHLMHVSYTQPGCYSWITKLNSAVGLQGYGHWLDTVGTTSPIINDHHPYPMDQLAALSSEYQAALQSFQLQDFNAHYWYTIFSVAPTEIDGDMAIQILFNRIDSLQERTVQESIIQFADTNDKQLLMRIAKAVGEEKSNNSHNNALSGGYSHKNNRSVIARVLCTKFLKMIEDDVMSLADVRSVSEDVLNGLFITRDAIINLFHRKLSLAKGKVIAKDLILTTKLGRYLWEDVDLVNLCEEWILAVNEKLVEKDGIRYLSLVTSICQFFFDLHCHGEVNLGRDTNAVRSIMLIIVQRITERDFMKVQHSQILAQTKAVSDIIYGLSKPASNFDVEVTMEPLLEALVTRINMAVEKYIGTARVAIETVWTAVRLLDIDMNNATRSLHRRTLSTLLARIVRCIPLPVRNMKEIEQYLPILKQLTAKSNGLMLSFHLLKENEAFGKVVLSIKNNILQPIESKEIVVKDFQELLRVSSAREKSSKNLELLLEVALLAGSGSVLNKASINHDVLRIECFLKKLADVENYLAEASSLVGDKLNAQYVPYELKVDELKANWTGIALKDLDTAEQWDILFPLIEKAQQVRQLQGSQLFRDIWLNEVSSSSSGTSDVAAGESAGDGSFLEKCNNAIGQTMDKMQAFFSKVSLGEISANAVRLLWKSSYKYDTELKALSNTVFGQHVDSMLIKI